MAVFNLDPNKQSITSSTQDHLDIETITENMLIMKNGVAAVVLQTSAVNFDLLSEFEQESKIKAFAGLLNSIDFNMQILIRTNFVDITDYIKKLKDINVEEQSANVRKQIQIYTEFIKKMTIKNQILDKKFYIVIPSLPRLVIKTNVVKQLFGKKEKITNTEQIIKDAMPGLIPKRNHVIRQLGRVGLQAKQLSTDELINLYYSLYNPDTITINKAGLSFDLLKKDSGEEEIIKKQIVEAEKVTSIQSLEGKKD